MFLYGLAENLNNIKLYKHKNTSEVFNTINSWK